MQLQPQVNLGCRFHIGPINMRAFLGIFSLGSVLCGFQRL